MTELNRRAHLNLVDSSQQLFELDPEAEVESTDGWLFGAGTPNHPAISNAVLLEPARPAYIPTEKSMRFPASAPVSPQRSARARF